MFQFRAFPPYTYLIQCTVLEYCSSVLPHSEISGSTLICSSPKLIAACHVLHRLLMPRHSPCALFSLTCSKESSTSFRPSFQGNAGHPFRSASFVASVQTRLRWALAGLRKRRFLCLVLYQELCRLNRIVKTKLYLPYKKFHN